MSDIKATLRILIESLELKKTALLAIEKLSREQEHLLKQDEFDYKAFSRTMNNKQIQIDKVIILDDGFKPEFERVQGRLTSNPKLYKDEIKQLKSLVKEVGEKGITIEVLERRNKLQFDIMSNSSKDKVKTFKKSKQAATNYYSSMNKHKNDDNSFFFDSKK